MTHAPPPPPIAAYAPDSFALFTIQQRLPRMLADVRAQLAPRHRSDPRWAALEAALLHAAPIDLEPLCAESTFWSDKLGSLVGRTWSDLSFFELEFLFQLAIRSIAHALEPGLDVFAAARRAALADALPRVASAAESQSSRTLEEVLLRSALGNAEDLSQLAGTRTGAAAVTLLHDQRADLVSQLRSATGTIQLLADNAGSELCFDLLLVDRSLTEQPGRIELQLKPRPMFVSDALRSDVEETVAAFERRAELAGAGARLRSALDTGRLALRAPDDWSEPRAMNALDPELERALRSASLVLVKGDLNYRRFFEDRAWPADTPVQRASVAHGMHAYGLRVLKSDSIVGLARARVAELDANDPSWRSSGRYAIVQRIDAGPAAKSRS